MYKYVLTLWDVWKHNLVESIPHTVVGTFISTTFANASKHNQIELIPHTTPNILDALTYLQKSATTIQDQSQT